MGALDPPRKPPNGAKTQPPFARTYAQIAHRRGRQIATVAIARRLLARCYHKEAFLWEFRNGRSRHDSRSWELT